MAFISTYFSYAGVRSEDMGVSLIHTDANPMMESQFFGEREIISELIPNRNTPYIYGQRISPIRVTLKISPMEGEWTLELKSKISRWLNNGRFNEFYSTDHIDKVYFLSYVGSPQLSETGMKQGWIEVEFLNLDCYVRSPEYTKIFDFKGIGTTPTIAEVEIKGDAYVYPDVYIQKIGAGDVSIRNLSNGGLTTSFTGLVNNEIIYMNGNDRYVETDIPDTYRYDNFSGHYLQLATNIIGGGSKNRLLVTCSSGGVKLKFVYRYLWTGA